MLRDLLKLFNRVASTTGGTNYFKKKKKKKKASPSYPEGIFLTFQVGDPLAQAPKCPLSPEQGCFVRGVPRIVPTGQHCAVLCLPLVSRPNSIQCYTCNESPLFLLSTAFFFFSSLFVWNKHIQMSCSVRVGEIQPCLFNSLLPSLKAGKYQVKFCTNLKNKSAAQKFFLIISSIIYQKKKKKKDNSYSAFITVTRIKHVILMLSSNLQMARCNQHI